MCSPITCRTCGKTTWTGCGKHVEAVMANVPKAQQCPGHDNTVQSGPPQSGPTTAGFLARIFGKA